MAAEILVIVFSMLTSLLFLGVVVALIVVGIRRRGGSGGGAPEEEGIGTVRRVFYYGLALVALFFAAGGVSVLLSETMEALAAEAVLREESFRVAFGLASTLVGFPIWMLLWRAAGRSVAEFPSERGSLGRKSYMYLVLGVSAIVVGVVLMRLVGSIFDPSRFRFPVLATALVWSALWGVHWAWESAEGQPSSISKSLRRFYIYSVSTFGLVLLAVGLAGLLTQLLGAAYDTLIGAERIGPDGPGPWTRPMWDALSTGIVGAVWWGVHWHRFGRGDSDSAPRQVVIYLIAIFGGLVVAVGAAANILHSTLLWLFGGSTAASAAIHFNFLSGAIALLVVAGGVWGYHASVVLTEAEADGERLVPARRTYRYLMAAVGLGTLATGLAALFGLIIGLLVPGAWGGFVATGWWKEPMAAVVTMLVVGVPLWWRYWSRLQAAALAGVPGEREALSRKIFIHLVFGIAVLATLGGLSTALVVILQALLEGRLTLDVLDDVRWALGTVLAAGAVSVYYRQVLREDRSVLAAMEPEADLAPIPTPASAVVVTILAPQAASGLVTAIAARLGVTPTLWWRADDEPAPTVTDAELDALAERVLAGAAEEVLLLVERDGMRMVPFRRVRHPGSEGA